MAQGKKPKKQTPWKKYLRKAYECIRILEEHKFEDFDLDWLKDAARWIERERHVTHEHIRAIENVKEALANMKRYKRWKEKARQRKESKHESRV